MRGKVKLKTCLACISWASPVARARPARLAARSGRCRAGFRFSTEALTAPCCFGARLRVQVPQPCANKEGHERKILGQVLRVVIVHDAASGPPAAGPGQRQEGECGSTHRTGSARRVVRVRIARLCPSKRLRAGQKRRPCRGRNGNWQF